MPRGFLMGSYCKRIRVCSFLFICLITIVCHCHVVLASETNHVDKIVAPKEGNFLLRPKVGRLIYEYDIYAFHKGDDLYFSLVDLIDILELSVNYDEETGKGSGWFLREDWKISIDLQNKTVVSKDKTYSVSVKLCCQVC